jgi:hypothetical protein
MQWDGMDDNFIPRGRADPLDDPVGGRHCRQGESVSRYIFAGGEVASGNVGN